MLVPRGELFLHDVLLQHPAERRALRQPEWQAVPNLRIDREELKVRPEPAVIIRRKLCGRVAAGCLSLPACC